jgi:hypothetical protein
MNACTLLQLVGRQAEAAVDLRVFMLCLPGTLTSQMHWCCLSARLHAFLLALLLKCRPPTRKKNAKSCTDASSSTSDFGS